MRTGIVRSSHQRKHVDGRVPEDIDALEDERDVRVSGDTNEADFIVWSVGNLHAGLAKIIDAVLGMLEWEPNGGHCLPRYSACYAKTHRTNSFER